MPIAPLPALRVYLVHAGVSAFSFAVLATLSSVYRFVQVGLTPLQLVLVGTVLLAELPTGVLADAVSRRLSVIVGAVLIGLGFVLEGLVPLRGAVILAQVVWGVGAAFESGALEAWLSDEIGEQPASRAFLRAAQVRQVAALAGIPVAALLGRSGLGLPLVVGGAGFLVLAAFLTLSMSEAGFAPVGAGDRHPLRSFAATLRRGAALGRPRTLVWSILAVALVAGSSSETFDRLWEAQMIAGPGLPARIGAPVWFALVAVATAVLGVVAAELARRALLGHDADGRARRATPRGSTASWIPPPAPPRSRRRAWPTRSGRWPVDRCWGSRPSRSGCRPRSCWRGCCSRRRRGCWGGCGAERLGGRGPGGDGPWTASGTSGSWRHPRQLPIY